MKYPLFSVFGVELEYMIVDKQSLQILPIADELIHAVVGAYVSDVERGTIDWSNELVNHVLELKTHRPEADLGALEQPFLQNIQEINVLLDRHNAMLLPTGAHPWMDPFTETRLWPHEHKEIYNLYNRIFDCRGHGWSNLQSTHLNLPFQGDEEFRRLHAAIRLLLPLIPAMSASTPFLDGKFSGFRDARLETYRKNQERFPIITGKVIPEPVYTREAYHAEIFEPIRNTIRPYDTDNLLDHHFLNSRGAIARFDRGAIEIRIIDLQECPGADLALLELFVSVLKELSSESWRATYALDEAPTDHLSDIFIQVIKDAESAVVTDKSYLQLLGFTESKLQASEIWQSLFERHQEHITGSGVEDLKIILREGSLSSRILRHTGNNPERDRLKEVYQQLSACLQNNQLFI